MTTSVATGFGRSVGVFSLNPEFPVEEVRTRDSVQSPLEAGMWQRRQVANSVNEVDFSDEVREWTLRWDNATKAEADTLREYYRQSRGGSGLLLYYPLTETGKSNLCSSGEDFKSPIWKRGTSDTTVTTDATALPGTVGGSAYLLTNLTGATVPAFIYALGGTYPAAGSVFAWSTFIQRPGSTPSGFVTIRLRNPTTADTEFVTFAWGGASWAVSASSGDVQGFAVVSGAWTRIGFYTTAGAASVSSYPSKRYVEIETGTTASPEANKGILISGAVLEEAPSVSELSSVASYNATRRHVLVRITNYPLRIERTSAINYRMEVTLREVPSAA